MVVLEEIPVRAKLWRFAGVWLSCGSLYLLLVPCVADGEWVQWGDGRIKPQISHS